MRVIILILTVYIVLLSGFTNSTCFGEAQIPSIKMLYRSPARYEKTIQAFENYDKIQPPPHGAIVFIGSSSVSLWCKTIKEDFAPLTIIPRGFGGSNMNEALYFANRIVIPYRPRAIIVYEGDNDVDQGIAPERIRDTFRAFVEKIQKELPGTRIYFISIKPSIARWDLWPLMKKTNELIALECSMDKLLTYIDVASPMLDKAEYPKEELFQEDQLHLNLGGYVVWRNTIKPVLLKNEMYFEKIKTIKNKTPISTDSIQEEF